MKIFLVDDDPSTITLFRSYLMSFDNTLIIKTYSSGHEVIDYLRRDEFPDLIICDYEMDNGNGGDVLKHIRTLNKNITFLLVSSKDLKSIEQDSGLTLNEGECYMEKPLKKDQLLEFFKFNI